jgi:hypothetical protein
MAKPNTRQLDRIISVAEGKLAGIEARQTWALTASEQARLAGLSALVIARDSQRAQQGRDAIWDGAAARYRGEIAAAKGEKDKVLSQAAAARITKKTKGWW